MRSSTGTPFNQDPVVRPVKPPLALLIDADQVGPDGIPKLLTKLRRKHTVDERICVRNWRSTKDQVQWRDAAKEHGFRLIQRDPVATGKNAADIELAIIAMDLFHAGKHRAFCIVTGDMDFRPLVERLERADCLVIWESPEAMTLGQPDRRAKARKAPSKTAKAASKPSKGTRPAKSAPANEPNMAAFAKAVRRVIGELQKEGKHERGWVSVNRIGNRLNVRGPWKEDFGFPKRRPLYESLEEAGFRVEQLETGQYQARMD